MKLAMSVFLSILFCLLIPVTTYADISGKPVVYVHGFQGDAFERGSTDESNAAAARAQVTVEAIPKGLIDYFIYFNSSKRLSHADSPNNVNYLRSQIRTLANKGLCSNGCVFLTASTGDLVTRYIFERKDQWLNDWQKKRLKLIASVDLFGAGGGTAVADRIADVVNKLNFNDSTPVLDEHLEEFSILFKLLANVSLQSTLRFGLDYKALRSTEDMGIGNDLRPSVAKRTAIRNTPYPRLRIAFGIGQGPGAYLFNGIHDGLIPLHSSCGSVKVESLWSCSDSIGINGLIRPVIASPKSLMHNHYPIIMAPLLPHGAIALNIGSGPLVPLNNNQRYNGIEVNFDEKITTKGHLVKRRYKTIDKDNSIFNAEDSFAQFLYKEFNK